jgi:AcrR family transcriptional regulator
MRATQSSRPRHRLRYRPGTRERIERTAYELFSRHGVRAVGVDTITARAGVAKMTLYKHYPSKDALVLAFLRRREELWSRAWLQHEAERGNGTAREKLLVIFDVFDKWFRRQDFEACAFVRVLLEHQELGHPVRRAAVRHIGNVRAFIKRLAADAGVRDVDGFARQWQMLMLGAIVAAYAGDRDAARRAKAVGARLIAAETAPHGGAGGKHRKHQ